MVMQNRQSQWPFIRALPLAALTLALALSVCAEVRAATGAAEGLADLGEGVGLTVYNQDFAIVRERRRLELPVGRSTMKFEDVAATIVPESVQFRSLDPPDAATVVEQNFEFDLVSASRLLHKYIDESIGIVTRDGGIREGTLLSFDEGQIVLSGSDGIELVPRGENVKDIRFAALPEGLLTRPTLVWQIEAQQAGKHLTQVAYRANQIRWEVDYRVVADEAGKTVDLSGWVTIDNRSGRTYADARLKLMAGDVHVVEERAEMEMARRARLDVRMPQKAMAFEEKAFAEYHLYELPRPTTIKDRQTKQIELIDVESVPVQRKYQYRGQGDSVHVILEFKNAESVHEGLGIPLPKGPIRVYQRDADGQSAFIGRDEIDHTPKGEPVKIRIGDAFDIRAERAQVEQRRPAPSVIEQDWRIRLRNHKDVPVTVEVVESLHGMTWDIPHSSQPHTKKDYRTIVFDVELPANGEQMVTYTVRYQH